MIIFWIAAAGSEEPVVVNPKVGKHSMLSDLVNSTYKGCLVLKEAVRKYSMRFGFIEGNVPIYSISTAKVKKAVTITKLQRVTTAIGYLHD
ncbi:hypothetical protein Tco_1403360 [Tanacetum coccineum]